MNYPLHVAVRGGDCLRTDSRLYLYSATWVLHPLAEIGRYTAEAYALEQSSVRYSA